MEILRGQRVKLSELVRDGLNFAIGVAAAGPGLNIDFACFGLDSDGNLADERYMTFFNQPHTPCGGVTLTAPADDAAGFNCALGKLPSTIERLVITAALGGPGVLSQLTSGHLRILDGGRETARLSLRGADFADERALMIGEFYRKDGAWRFCATGQGFNGGLDALVRHFGGAVAEPTPAAPVPSPVPPAAPSPSRVSLDKRIEREAPQLVSLVKQATVSLEKVGLAAHRARVCLCLDISGSMAKLYKSGVIQAFSERILALGCRFDDDGEIDVFLFGEKTHHPESMNLSNCHDYIRNLTRRYPLEGDTRYGLAMAAIRQFYFPDGRGEERRAPTHAPTPVYVMFVTDGSTSDQGVTEKQVRWSSYEPIFWQFMGIGKGRKSKKKRLFAFADSDFPFLEKLDELSGRFLDNADFFAVSAPDEHSDAALYDLLMSEYPQWVQQAKQRNMIA